MSTNNDTKVYKYTATVHCQGCYKNGLELNKVGQCEECIDYFSDWTFEKPLREDVPEGYEIVDTPLKEEHFERHDCGCEFCEYDDYQLDTRDMGLVMEEGEAFGKKITWFGIRDRNSYSWSDDPTIGGDEPGLEPRGGIGYSYYLGHGCWTRYEEDEYGRAPFGEHVTRQLKKKGSCCHLDQQTPSQVGRNFQNNAINNDLMSVPGVGGRSAMTKLATQSITTTAQLAGQFWMLDRNVEKFTEFLEDCGIQNRFARACAENMKQKFGSI